MARSICVWMMAIRFLAASLSPTPGARTSLLASSPTTRERKLGPQDDRHAEAEQQVSGDRSRMEAAADLGAFQRQHDEPQHQQRRQAEHEPAQPPSEAGGEPRLEQRSEEHTSE